MFYARFEGVTFEGINIFHSVLSKCKLLEKSLLHSENCSTIEIVYICAIKVVYIICLI